MMIWLSPLIIRIIMKSEENMTKTRLLSGSCQRRKRSRRRSARTPHRQFNCPRIAPGTTLRFTNVLFLGKATSKLSIPTAFIHLNTNGFSLREFVACGETNCFLALINPGWASRPLTMGGGGGTPMEVQRKTCERQIERGRREMLVAGWP